MEIKLFNRIYCIKKDVLIIAVSILVILIGIVGYILSREHKNTIIFEPHKDAKSIDAEYGNESSTNIQSSDEKVVNEEIEFEDEERIDVYITGCVNKPGIVSLKKGQIINDAIVAAGGATSEADLNNINLVYKLESNVMLHIRSKDEVRDSGEQGEAGLGIEIIRDSRGAVIYEEISSADISDKVNINTADIRQLTTLPGIGEATAKEIIEYRDQNGKFKAIEDIMKVPRIKEGRFNAIKDLIMVD